MRCDDCGRWDCHLIGGLCPACRQHPRNQGDDLAPLDGQPEGEPVDYDGLIRDLFDGQASAGIETVEEMDAAERARAAALYLDRESRQGPPPLEFLIEGDRTPNELPERGPQADARLMANVVAALTSHGIGVGKRAIADEICERAERFLWSWMEQELERARDRHAAAERGNAEDRAYDEWRAREAG